MLPKCIFGFINEYFFLSNFYRAPFYYNDLLFPTVEHAFHWAKAADPREKKAIFNARYPGEAKLFGRRCKMVPDWESTKLAIMEELVYQKFKQHPDLAQKLLDTGVCLLEETNTWGDSFWGVSNGSGQNHLGKILMKVRDRLWAESEKKIIVVESDRK